MLKTDYELSREDIQLLSSRDALAALFAKLGYDTNDRLIQNVAAMGFTSDNLKSAIIHIERLASQDARICASCTLMCVRPFLTSLKR
jgi:hypothetical protein